MTTCQDVREATAEVQEHVEACDLCRVEISRLTQTAQLLETTTADLVDAPSGRDDAMLNRLLDEAARRSRRRRHVVGWVAAALLLVVPAGAWTVHEATQTNPTSVVAVGAVHGSSSDPATGVSGDVTLTPAAWGSDLAVSVDGVPRGTTCTLIVVTRSGRHLVAGTWHATYDGSASVTATVDAPVDSISRIDVVDSGHKVLLAVPFT
jgi:hypothetical protein